MPDFDVAGKRRCGKYLFLDETDRNSSQQSLGHVGNDDTDKEDDGVQPVTVPLLLLLLLVLLLHLQQKLPLGLLLKR